MKMIPWRLVGVALFCAAPLLAADFAVTSPDGKIRTDVSSRSDGLYYQVTWEQRVVVAFSRLGLSSDGRDITVGAVLGSTFERAWQETYPLMGGHAQALNDAKEVTVPITSAQGEKYTLELRLQNDGMAWRFRLPAKPGRKIGPETSEWKLPLESMIWSQPDLGSYEGIFTGGALKTLAAPKSGPDGKPSQTKTIPLPITAELPGGGYALVTEAAVVDFADSATKLAADGSLALYLQGEPGGWITDQVVVQPWRVLVLARDLNALVNTDFISNLNPPPGPEFANADWIKPGRSTWQWWCSGGPKLNEQAQWLDWTWATGFDYYLIDEGWKNWKQGDLKDWALLQQVADEAKAKNVKLWIWLHSREVATHSALVEFMDKVAALGVVGVKIDFIPRCSRNWSNWYVDVLREAAKRKLMVDFHGATKPTGMERTWPNEVSRESVRGHEWHISRYNRVLPPSHDTVLPFTRYVIGHGDYTPTVFNPAELKGYTWPRELAQAIVFTSPYLCYADHPKNYLANPAFDVMKEIPSTWDETRVLPGSAIGECAAFARRKGKDWFIGVINGGQPKTLKVALDFLGTETYRATLLAEDSTKDDAFARTEKNLTAKETLTLSMRGSSGFVARLKVTNPGP